MKSPREMLEVAVRIVGESENARVLFVTDSYLAMVALRDVLLELLEGEFLYNFQTNRYTHSNGAVLMLGWITEGDKSSYAEVQITHLFVTMSVDWASQQWLTTRIRSIHSFATPMGRYDPYGAVIRTKY